MMDWQIFQGCQFIRGLVNAYQIDIGLTSDLKWIVIGLAGLTLDWQSIDVRLASDFCLVDVGLAHNCHRVGMDRGVERDRNRPPLRLEGFPHSTLVPLLLTHLSSDWSGIG